MGAFANKTIAASEDVVGRGHATKDDTLNRAFLIGHNNLGYHTDFPGQLVRPKFTWKDADEIYISAGVYHLDGTDEIVCQWNAQITFQFGSGGSNAASDDLGASEWHYLYIDDSAVQTAATNILTASEFLNSTTAPTWSHTKHGWYNGNDRCIGAFLTDGANNMLAFWHDGGRQVLYDAPVTFVNAADIDSAWTDATVTAPGFATRAVCRFKGVYVDSDAWFCWRPNGSSSTNGHSVVLCNATTTDPVNTVDVMMDSAQKIEVKSGSDNGDTLTVYAMGFYLPAGM